MAAHDTFQSLYFTVCTMVDEKRINDIRPFLEEQTRVVGPQGLNFMVVQQVWKRLFETLIRADDLASYLKLSPTPMVDTYGAADAEYIFRHCPKVLDYWAKTVQSTWGLGFKYMNYIVDKPELITELMESDTPGRMAQTIRTFLYTHAAHRGSHHAVTAGPPDSIARKNAQQWGWTPEHWPGMCCIALLQYQNSNIEIASMQWLQWGPTQYPCSSALMHAKRDWDQYDALWKCAYSLASEKDRMLLQCIKGDQVSDSSMQSWWSVHQAMGTTDDALKALLMNNTPWEQQISAPSLPLPTI